MIKFDRRLVKNFCWPIFFLTLLISAIGLVNLYSASYYSGLKAFKRQVIWTILGIVTITSVSFINYKTLYRYALHIYYASIIILVLVLIAGKEVSGSKSWLSLGPINIQPSEFIKISTVLIISRFYHNDFNDGPYGIRELLKPIIFIGIFLILILLQPDLGTAIMVLLVGGSMFLFMGIKKKTIVAILAAIAIFSVPAWNFLLEDYQKNRIKTFIDPSVDPFGTGYNTLQSQIAIGSGKLFGKGFLAGTQTQLRFIPAQQTDFAFSVLGEEWGFIGAASVLFLYLLFILYIIDVASSAKDRFSMLLALGIAMIFFWHTLINIGMVLGLMPVIGVPFIFFSYGGSSILTAFIGMGIVLGIKMRQKPAPREKISLGTYNF